MRAGGETAAAMVRSASVSAMAPPRTPAPPTPAFSGRPAEAQPSAAKPVPYEGTSSGAHAAAQIPEQGCKRSGKCRQAQIEQHDLFRGAGVPLMTGKDIVHMQMR